MRPYLINLPRRPDRLEQFRQRQKENGWKLEQPEIVPAVDGSVLPIPQRFKTCAGAWGCTRSHINILETVLARGENEAIIFEDDVTWEPDAWEKLDHFLAVVPKEWELLMIGGQHMAEPIKSDTIPGVVRCRYTTRTHAYIIRGKAIYDLLLEWYECKSHLDHHLGLWMTPRAVYAPSPFIFGQGGCYSDITCKEEAIRNWA